MIVSCNAFTSLLLSFHVRVSFSEVYVCCLLVNIYGIFLLSILTALQYGIHPLLIDAFQCVSLLVSCSSLGSPRHQNLMKLSRSESHKAQTV